MMTTLFGIKNCDTIKKAQNWLTVNGIEHKFHDYRVDGIEQTQLEQWCNELGWEQVLNRRGTTWRKLPDEIKNTIDENSAITLMLEQPAMIKRPLLDSGTQRLLGFKAAEYQQLFKL
jgi:arsenate reductase (glutaredoxin)